MALSPIRKWLNIGFGCLLVLFVGALVWPLLYRPFELHTFCAGLASGASEQTIRRLADQHGFKVSAADPSIAHVYDLQSLGKFSCALQMQGGALTTASFRFAD
jgi:hypothetical protein